MVYDFIACEAAEIQIGLIDVDESTILQACDRCRNWVDVEELGEQIAGLAEAAVGIIHFPGAGANTFLQLRGHLPMSLFSSFEFCNIQKGDYKTFNSIFSRAIRTHAYHVPVTMFSLHFAFYRLQVS